MSPELNSKDKRARNFNNSLKDEDNISKYSDEKRSTLPLHSDSFKKHSSRKGDYIYQDDPHQNIIDTEKRNQHQSPLQSPHFMKDYNLSSSNPFAPCDTNGRSLMYDSPPKDSGDYLKMIIDEFRQKMGDDKAEYLLKHIVENEKAQQTSQRNSTFDQEIKKFKSENENLSIQLKLCKEANTKLNKKVDTYSERSSTLEKMLRERESKLGYK